MAAPGQSLVARFLDYVRALDPTLLPDGSPRYIVTANACFCRSAFEQVGGFDETFASSGGEDTEIGLRMRQEGMKLVYSPRCQVSHWYDSSVVDLLRRYYRYGYSNRLI